MTAAAPRRVLVVEDDAKIAQLLLDHLRSEGFEASSVADGQIALRQIEATPPAAVILDLMLPGLDGISVCKAVRRFSEVPILMLTARIEEVDRLLGLDSGADDYVCKPFGPREVVARVRALLRRSEGRVFSRSQLLDCVHDDLRDVSDRAIDSHIKNLRRKIEAVEPGCDCIASVYGIGYRFELPVSSPDQSAQASGSQSRTTT